MIFCFNKNGWPTSQILTRGGERSRTEPNHPAYTSRKLRNARGASGAWQYIEAENPSPVPVGEDREASGRQETGRAEAKGEGKKGLRIASHREPSHLVRGIAWKVIKTNKHPPICKPFLPFPLSLSLSLIALRSF